MGDSTIYKILKQGYPATYTFKDDTIGGNPAGWVLTEGDGTINVIASLDGHRKVVEMSRVTQQQIMKHTFASAQVNETVEFYMGVNNIGAKNAYVYIYEGAEAIISLRFYEADMDEYDGGAWNSIKDDFIVVNTLYYIKLILDDTANTYDVYINGVLEGNNIAYRNNSTVGMEEIRFITNTDDMKMYIDAVGFSHDTNYNVGDNIHWRNYKESTDSFEGDDVGTQGTSITWVDSVNVVASVEIVPEFNEHKKILRQTSAAGGNNYSRHNFASQSKTGWYECWVKVSDITSEQWIILTEDATLIIQLRITASQFQIYTAGAWRQVTGSSAPVNDTWYHIYIQWYDAATDTFDLWIDNVLYEDGTNCANNQTSGINIVFVRQYTAAEYIYLDAPISSLDSDAKADNRIFEYHPLSKTNITSECSKCSITKAVTVYSTASIETSQTLGDEHYLQIIDENSDLRFIGNRFKDIDIGISINGYSFQDLNKVELEEEDSYTASSAEDVNASLLAILTNVGQASGRLIYYTEDDPAGNLTPNYRNKPRHMITRILAIRGAKKCIIKASGKIFLDDDANPDNGSATITETSSELMAPPLIDMSSHQINYVEVRGGIDPDTGTPFSGISQDASAQADGTGIIPYYKRLRELQSDTDCQNMAIAIRTGTNFTPQILRVRLRGIYADPGEIINLAYANKSFSATNCYVDSVRMNVLTNVCTYSLNTGIFDPITLNAPGYTMADETADDVAGSLYERTNTKSIPFYPATSLGGSWHDKGVQLDGDGEYLDAFLYIGDKVDDSRDITITFIWERMDANNDTIDGRLYIVKYDVSGTDNSFVENATPITLEASLATDYGKYQYILAVADISNDYIYEIAFGIIEAGRDIVVSLIEVRTHFKK